MTTKRNALLATGVVTALGGTLVGALNARAHNGVNHYLKNIFSTRSYQDLVNNNYVAWQTYATSNGFFNCDGSEQVCKGKWDSVIGSALGSWNDTNTTVFFQRQTDNSGWYDFSLNIRDVVNGDPELLGLFQWYDTNQAQCTPECATGKWWTTYIYIGDDAHNGAYGTDAERKGTLVHELGHGLSLQHELPTNPNVACGTNGANTPLPRSVENYNCIDPTTLGGFGINVPQPWDVCGVNHVYPDPAYGQSGCEQVLLPTATPTRTPTPVPTATPTPTGGGGGGGK